MKKFFLFVFVLFNVAGWSQEIRWVKNIEAPAISKGLVTDRQSNVYNYGSVIRPGSVSQNGIEQDKNGSYVYKFSPEGNLVFKKRWPQSFHIQKMVYDGSKHFYFAGTFFGNINVDGLMFSSRGGADGCVGCMNESGTVLWMRSFGDLNHDVANGITMNDAGTRIAVTGGLSDNLFVNGELVAASGQKSMLVAEFDLKGNLTAHKMLNFMASRNEENMGYEICMQPGGYLLLGHQEGRFWTDDTTNVPDYGTYVYKLESDLSIAWSQFIINGGCYYGFSCAGLSASAGGDAYIPSFCSYKYGGNGTLRRLASVNGIATWTLGNTDGTYSDTYCAAGNLYLTGTEGANGCPCEDNDAGYQVLKSYDSNNSLRMLIKAREVRFTQVTRDQAGIIYVAGSYQTETATIGGFMVSGGVKDYYPYRGTFLFAVNDLPTALPQLLKTNTVFAVYPNPSAGQFRFELRQDKPIGRLSLRVHNLLGAVQVQQVTEVSGNVYAGAIDMSNQPKGLYFVEVIAGDTRHLRQLVIQ